MKATDVGFQRIKASDIAEHFAKLCSHNLVTPRSHVSLASSVLFKYELRYGKATSESFSQQAEQTRHCRNFLEDKQMADFTNPELFDRPVADASNQSTHARIFEDAYSTGAGVSSKVSDKLTGSTTQPTYALSEFIPENSQYMPLAIDLIDDIANGGYGSNYKEVNELSKTERFQLANDMHDIAKQFNDHYKLVPGKDIGALAVEAQVNTGTEFVVDIDVVRTQEFIPSPRQERLDVYDPGFWTFEKGCGRKIDMKQALNERTYQYEKLAEAMYGHEYLNLIEEAGASSVRRNYLEASLDSVNERAATQMIKDLYRGGEDFDGLRDLLKDNLIANIEKPHQARRTTYTEPLFAASRFQRAPIQDLQILIDELDAGLR